jgi:hypothetical protein
MQPQTASEGAEGICQVLLAAYNRDHSSSVWYLAGSECVLGMVAGICQVRLAAFQVLLAA